jgi:hypothetical protein
VPALSCRIWVEAGVGLVAATALLIIRYVQGVHVARNVVTTWCWACACHVRHSSWQLEMRGVLQSDKWFSVPQRCAVILHFACSLQCCVLCFVERGRGRLKMHWCIFNLPHSGIACLLWSSIRIQHIWHLLGSPTLSHGMHLHREGMGPELE